MANPQLENGYTKISNELLEAICKTRLSDYEHRVLMMIIRKTYGFNKKADWICLKKLSDDTEIRLPHISRTITNLLERNIISKQNRKVSIQKDYEKWLPKEVTKKVTQRGNVTQTGNHKKVTNLGNEVTYTGNKKLPIQVDTKEKKETIQKKGSSKPKFSTTSIEFELSEYLYKKIQKLDRKFPEPNLQSWATHTDRLIRLDNRDPKLIRDTLS